MCAPRVGERSEAGRARVGVARRVDDDLRTARQRDDGVGALTRIVARARRLFDEIAMLEHARELASHGVGVIYIGHNLTEILKVADRIAVMFRGRTVHVTAAGDTTQETLIKYMTGYSETEKAA